MGTFQVDTVVAVFATTGVVLGAAYMLVLYRRVVFGEQKNEDAAAMPDLTKLEFSYFVPLIVLVIWLGVTPNVVMSKISPSVNKLIGQYYAGIGKEPVSVTDVVHKKAAPTVAIHHKKSVEHHD